MCTDTLKHAWLLQCVEHTVNTAGIPLSPRPAILQAGYQVSRQCRGVGNGCLVGSPGEGLDGGACDRSRYRQGIGEVSGEGV